MTDLFDTRARFAYWHAKLPETGARRRVLNRWSDAMRRHQWDLADILFDHLWPGVWRDAI